MRKWVKYLSLVFAAAVCINLTACGVAPEGTNSSNSINSSSDNSEGLFSGSPEADPPEDAVYYDYSMYEGLWLSADNNLYPDTYLQLDAHGKWTLTKDGEETDNGYLQYNDEEVKIYAYSNLGGAIDGGYLSMDGDDRLYISTCGYFNYLDGRGGQWQGGSGSNWDGEDREASENDFSMYEGLWQSDETNIFTDTYVQFDAKGNFQLFSDGETIDEGYIKYDASEGEIYTHSKRGGFIDDSVVRIEDGKLCISVCGYFNRLN